MNAIIFSENAAVDLTAVLSELKCSSLFVLTDENTKANCQPLVEEVFPSNTAFFTVEAGERNKTISTCMQIWAAMTKAQLDRKALFLNIGGGVIGDMGGFCASIYKRGIRFINMPTTLLSQVDASVGGKLGVDFEGLKNHLGVFNEPETVIVASEFLKTLPKEEIRSGYAEIMKHGLIRDKVYFESLDFDNWEKSYWSPIIHHSVEIKKSVVKEDPKEAGLRKILNFGHTIGHAFETYFLDGPRHLLHGEAIAVGMICEAYLSKKKLDLSMAELKEIETAFLKVYGKVEILESDLPAVLDFCLQDKKNEGKELMFSLLTKIGECTYNIPVTRAEIREAIHHYQNLPQT
ncbi:3-dehydroquinate synthase [Algoriphagus chordae]|uniref:3-dehydroquinate synthase n=1 Tax=Algoriphagus chordae TaxID=237019 RepID=A0A2W7SL50_9BACT|nr:3-dehydroquinate synthase [Algoriphagus chordae]PZX51402.1 3-dehydroquinate synthase [Algoriphagus chordae]